MPTWSNFPMDITWGAQRKPQAFYARWTPLKLSTQIKTPILLNSSKKLQNYQANSHKFRTPPIRRCSQRLQFCRSIVKIRVECTLVVSKSCFRMTVIFKSSYSSNITLIWLTSPSMKPLSTGVVTPDKKFRLMGFSTNLLIRFCYISEDSLAIFKC